MCKEKQIRFIRNNNQEEAKKFSPFEWYTVEESLRYIDCSIDKLYRLIRSGRVPVRKNDKNTSRFILCIKGVDLLNLCRNEEGNLVYCEGNSTTSEQDIEKFEGDYGWYEGYFYLNELDNFLSQKKNELDGLIPL